MFTCFSVENPRDLLLWRDAEGQEISQRFNHPQKWSELVDSAWEDQRDRIPDILQADLPFALMFLLAFPHRAVGSLIKFLDEQLAPLVTRS
jgi:hypothetical protein